MSDLSLEDTRVCPRPDCQALNRPCASYCRQCGAPLPASSPTEQAQNVRALHTMYQQDTQLTPEDADSLADLWAGWCQISGLVIVASVLFIALMAWSCR